jgi:hypothetical protein
LPLQHLPDDDSRATDVTTAALLDATVTSPALRHSVSKHAIWR